MAEVLTPSEAPPVPDKDGGGGGREGLRHGQLSPGRLSLEEYVAAFDRFCQCEARCECPWTCD